MLLVPRPRTRGECLEEARPCPWVGCRHHLLLEVAATKQGPPKLVLNRPPRHPGAHGRKQGLYSSAAEALVRVWLDDAIELLARLRYSCALDVIDDYPQGIPDSALGELLGVTRQASHALTARGLVRLRAGLDLDDE